MNRLASYRAHIASRAALCLVAAASARAAVVEIGSQRFTLPDGFVVERIAGPELTQRPVHADFDERGRLYVAESSGSNEPVQKQLEEKPHSLLRLEDRDGDGLFDVRTVFADRLMLPEGVLWHGGSVYVAAPPAILKLTDTDGDGISDEREEWYNPGTLTGCANDLHGPFLGREGWIYWAKGAFAEQSHQLPGDRQLRSRAAHLFRRHPAGGPVEVIMTGGMDNPVEMVMNSAGERFFTSTFMLHPGGGRRDGIGHAEYGALFGKEHNVLEGHPRGAAALSEPMTHLGPAAPAGLCLVEGGGLGDEYRGNLFAALFNLQKISRHVLIADGNHFGTIDEDFLTSNNRDFHPTDVLESADGSLVVIDTGGWYKICCPTSQLYKPDVLGAIYRVRRVNAPVMSDPSGNRLDWTSPDGLELALRLEDERPFVRKRAVDALGKLGTPAVAALGAVLRKSSQEEARAAAVWALSRIPGDAARSFTATAVLDGSDAVRQAALHSMALWRDREAVPQLVEVLRHGSPMNRSAAAEALGRIGDAVAVPALVKSVTDDARASAPFVRALVDIGRADAIRTSLAEDTAPSAIPAGLILALDQLDAATSVEVMPLLASPRSDDRETARWILKRHLDWGDELAARLVNGNGLQMDVDARAQLLAEFAKNKSVQRTIADATTTAPALALRAMARAGRGMKEAPDEWAAPLAAALTTSDAELLAAALDAARACRFKQEHRELQTQLRRLAGDASATEPARVGALAAMRSGGAISDPQLETLLQALLPDRPVAVRRAAIEALERARLGEMQYSEIANGLKHVGPMELLGLVALFDREGPARIGLQLVNTLSVAESRSALRGEVLRPILEKYPPEVVAEAGKLLTELAPDLAGQRLRVEALLRELGEGNVRRGQELFNSSKTACSACHAIGYLGGTLGPDLTRVGQVRSERDLLEAIVYPNASFVRSFEPVRVTTKDGIVVAGVLQQDGHEEIVVGTGPETSMRVAQEDIVAVEPGTVSVMPGGMAEQLSRQELADLLAFLKATRW